MAERVKAANDINVPTVEGPSPKRLAPYTTDVGSRQSKSIRSCNPMPKAPVYEASLGWENEPMVTVVGIVRAASQKAQLVHNEEVQDVESDEIVADEMWSFIRKNKNIVDLKSCTSRRLLDRR